MSIEFCLLSHIRAWWRPLSGIAIGASLFVHGVFVPLFLLICKNQYYGDLTGLAALVTASGVPIAVREWGKIKSNG